jgi:hypothetical protein
VVPDLDPTYFLFASIPVALSGAFITLNTGMSAYITDTTAAERRAFRCVFGTFCFFSYIFHIGKFMIAGWKTKWTSHVSSPCGCEVFRSGRQLQICHVSFG